MKHKAKTLKVRIQDQDGLREIYLKPKQKYRIGHDTSNDLTLYGKHVPKRHILFEGEDNKFVLNVDAHMKGQLSNETSSLNIQDLLDYGLLSKKGKIYRIPIRPDKKGWVQVGDTRFEFEFEKAAPADLLKDEAKFNSIPHQIVKTLTTDVLYKLVVLLFLSVGVLWSVKVYNAKPVPPKKFSLEKVTNRVAKFIIRPKKTKIASPASRPGVASKQESKTSEKKSSEKKANTPEAKKKAALEAAKKAVARKGLLGLIAGKGSSGKSGTVVDALIDKGLVKELDEALQSGTDLQVQLPSLNDKGGDLSGLLNGDSLPSVDNLITNDQVNENFNLKEKGGVNLEEMSELSGSDKAMGYRSQQSIRDVIVSYMGRVTYVYNKYLKTNPDLRGKVLIEITIAASGDVTNAKIISSTVGNRAFENELLSVVRRFKFKPIPEGVVTVQNPFVFYRSDMN